MKRILNLFIIALSISTSMNAQREIDSLTYENTQDITFFKNIKNKTLVYKYKTINKNVIQIGDTVILGNPTSQEFNSRTYSVSYGNKARGGVSN